MAAFLTEKKALNAIEKVKNNRAGGESKQRLERLRLHVLDMSFLNDYWSWCMMCGTGGVFQKIGVMLS